MTQLALSSSQLASSVTSYWSKNAAQIFLKVAQIDATADLIQKDTFQNISKVINVVGLLLQAKLLPKYFKIDQYGHTGRKTWRHRCQMISQTLLNDYLLSGHCGKRFHLGKKILAKVFIGRF